MVGPWIAFLRKRAGGRLSDIEFLAIKAFGGKLVKNEGFLSATGDLATLTASSGKDMYLARAKVTFYSRVSNPSSVGDKIELKVNGTVVETTGYSMLTNAIETSYEFKNIGHKVAATQIIKLEVTVLATDTDVEGFIECFEETTGETPQIPSI